MTVPAPYTENYLFEAEILDSNLYSSDSSHVAVIGYQDENNVYFWGPYHWTSFNWGNNKNLAEKVEDDEGKGVYGEDRTPFPMVFGIRRNGTTTYIYRNRELRDTDESTTINWDKAGFTLRDWLSPYGIYAKFDWALIRKYTKPEPTVIVTVSEVFDPTKWKYYEEITIKENSGNNLTDYQVRILLNSTNFDFSKAKLDGPDIRFTDSNNNILPYWVEKWDYTNETASIWVKVPYIPADGEAKIKMYYGNPNAESKSNFEGTFIDPNADFEMDPSGTAKGNISKWSFRYGYSGFADNKWENTQWEYIQYAEVVTDAKVSSANYYHKEKSYYGYIKLHHTTFPYDRGVAMELYTEDKYKAVVEKKELYVYLHGLKIQKSSRWAIGISVVLDDGINKSRVVLVTDSWNGKEGCIGGKAKDNYISKVTGADGNTWKKYRVTVPDNLDKSNLTISLRQWQDAWDETTASHSVYWDYIEGFRLRKYVFPEPTVIIKTTPVAYFTYSTSGLTVEFNASLSYDPDGGDIVLYTWDFGDRNITNTTEETIKHSYSEAGSYEVTLTVTDDEGATNSTTKEITVPPAPEANILFNPSKSIIGVGLTAEINLTLDKAQNGLSGYNITVSLSNTTVAEITSVSFPDWATLHSNSTLPADSLWIKATDLYDKIKSGATNITLATITLRGDERGKSDILVTVTKMDDDNENPIDPNTVSGKIEVIEVVPFPGCENPPTDPDRDGLYEDINGNGRKGFNDVVVFFNYLKWVEENQPCIECFDFNKNGRIDFDDVVKLFEEI